MVSSGWSLWLRLAGTAYLVTILFGDTCSSTLLADVTVKESEISLSEPRGVCVIRQEKTLKVLVASSGNHRIVLLRKRSETGLDESPRACSLEPDSIVIEGRKGGPLKNPNDVAVDSSGRVLVADTGNDAVKIYEDIYDERRYSVRTIGSRLRGIFSSPEGIAVDERDNIIVFDTGNGKVQILSPDGKSLAVISGRPGQVSPDIWTPGRKPEAFLGQPIDGCCLGKGYLAVADRLLPVYSIWRYDPLSPRTETCRFVGYGRAQHKSLNFHVRDIAYSSEYGCMAYLASNFPLRNAAFLYLATVDPDDPGKSAHGETLAWTCVPLVGWLKDPRGVAFSPQGDLFVTDSASGSVQKINRDSLAVLGTPVKVDAKRTSAQLEYFSTDEVATLLEYSSVPDHIRRMPGLRKFHSDPEETLAHSVQLTDLIPSTRYAYRFLLTRECFRRVSGRCLPCFSRTLLFATQPGPGTMQYLDLPLTVLVFAEVEGGASGGALTDEQVHRLHSQLEAAGLFFWVNSRMTCNVTIQPKPFVIKEPVKAALLPHLEKGAGRVPSTQLDAFVSELDRLVQKYAGRELGLWSNIFIISPGESRPVTFGLPHPGGAVSTFSYAEDMAWAFIREYQEHLSIMHLASGKDVTLPALLRYIEGDRSNVLWDSRADLVRAVGKQASISNPFGILRITADHDEDGFPDDEPACPLDEKRFGSSPGTKDTDGDGVSDLDELLASRWAAGFGVEGTRVVDSGVRPSPSLRDSDGDGVEDLPDKNPLCPLNDSIPALDVVLEGKIGQDEWLGASSLKVVDHEYKGVLRLAWNNKNLCFSLAGEGDGASQGPPFIRVRLDGAADGFMRGSDNLTLLFEPKADGSFTVRQETGQGAFSPDGPPVAQPWDDIKMVTAAWRRAGEGVHVEIGLPRSPAVGLNLLNGEEVGFDLELQPPKSSTWLRVFEPLSLFRGVLVQQISGAKE